MAEDDDGTGADYSRREVLRGVGAVGLTTGVEFAYTDDGGQGGGDYPAGQPPRGDPRPYEAYTIHRVPADYDTIQAAVDAASPEDLVLVSPGLYREAVRVTDTPRLTIRGTSRSGVVLEGEFEREDGVFVTADDVVLENMTARHYTRNGFFWTGVEGYRGSYLTAHNNRLYGVYAFGSVHGRFDNSYASGHSDSGFYIGQCQPCHAIIEGVLAEYNAIGYSGTNAGGYLTIRDSEWRDNMAGVVPNSLDSEALAPQDSARIENNLVEANNFAAAPDTGFGYAAFGTGITIAGGRNNEVFDNVVRDHDNFGIATLPMIDDNLYEPANNRIQGNAVEGSGRVDLALGAPQAGKNRFVDNQADSSRPAGLTGGFSILPADPWVTLVLLEQYLALEFGSAPSGDWRTAPGPAEERLEGMSEPAGTPPREAVRRDS